MKRQDYHRQILRIALPAIVTNITVPLLGLVDTAIVGHMGDATYLAAVGVGTMIFNLIYWVFGFLRMGTSGMTAQAWGGRDLSNVKVLLKRSTTVSLGIATLILLLQWPLRELMLWLIGPTADVRPLAVTYFNIVVWGAPAVLTLYSLSGWFIGMQNTRLPMTISILQNIINIGASLTLVYGYGMKMEGIALGTVIAQYAGLLAAIALLWHYYKKLLFLVPPHPRTSVPSHPRTPQFLAVNRDIFLRTLCLVAVNLYFTSAGARQGATILAVNTLMMQLFLPFSYIMDGFAYAGEALGGRYWGARQWENFRAIVGHLFGWGAMMTLLFTLAYIFGATSFLQLLTDEQQVMEAAETYIGWTYLIPICGVGAFVWDGIFIGTTQTRGMLLSAAIAAGVFFVGTAILIGAIGNHGLWLSMMLFLALRGVTQTIWFATRLQKNALFRQ